MAIRKHSSHTRAVISDDKLEFADSVEIKVSKISDGSKIRRGVHIAKGIGPYSGFRR